MSNLTESHVQTAIQQMVTQTKKLLCIDKPIEYNEAKYRITTYLGLPVVEQDLGADDGFYVPSPAPLIIVNPLMDSSRLVFTLFHELTHHLLKNNNEIYSFIHEYTASHDDMFTSTLEKYCNLGAAEFILPSSDVRQIIKQKGFIISLIKDLDEMYPASKPAIAIQLAVCASHKCFILICKHGVVPKNTRSGLLIDDEFAGHTEGLYVEYAMFSPTVPYRFRRHTRIPNNHPIYESYKHHTIIKSNALIPSWNTEKLHPCEAFYYKGKVYAVFHLSLPPSPLSKHQMIMDL